jgi:hypothetical protein
MWQTSEDIKELSNLAYSLVIGGRVVVIDEFMSTSQT